MTKNFIFFRNKIRIFIMNSRQVNDHNSIICLNENCPIDHQLLKKFKYSAVTIDHIDMMLERYFTLMVEITKNEKIVSSFFRGFLHELKKIVSDSYTKDSHFIYEINYDIFKKVRKEINFTERFFYSDKKLIKKIENFRAICCFRGDSISYNYNPNFIFNISRVGSFNYQMEVNFDKLTSWFYYFRSRINPKEKIQVYIY